MIDVTLTTGYILVQRIKEHDIVKPKLLSLIDKMPVNSANRISTNWEVIDKTDYFSGVDALYKDVFLETIHQYNENVKNFYKAEEIKIKHYWYQQYNHNDYHTWHVHPNCLLSNVYYVELTDNNSTVFYDYLESKEIKYDFKEGDLVTFPSFIPHKSQNNGNNRKTIISYNTDFNRINIQ